MHHTTSRYPVAYRQDWLDELHGCVVPDPYRWLEGFEDPQTVAWLAAQERLFADERARWRDAERWQTAVSDLCRFPLTSVPRPRGARTFFTRRDAGADHATLMVAEGDVERPLVSPLSWDSSGRTVLEAWRPSWEGDLLSFQLSVGGAEDSLLRTVDVTTGELVDGPIDRVRRSPVAWLPGGTAYYYVRRLPADLNPGEDRYHRRVYLHRVGSDPDDDVLIFGEGRDRTQFYWVALTPDGRWLTISATNGTERATDLWLADLHTSLPESPDLRPVQTDTPARSSLRIPPGTGPNDPIWLRTDLDAPRGRLVVATPADCRPGSWRTLIAERPDAVLEDVAVLLDGQLESPLALVSWTRHSVSEVTVHDLTNGRQLATLPLPGSGTAGPLTVRPERGHEVWFSYSDHVTPPQVLRYDGRTGELERWAHAGIAIRPAVTARQVTYASHDGQAVRMFVISRAGFPDRPRPTVLTGYGGFGISMTPSYSPAVLAWTLAGGVYAIACVRGGGDEGEQWHRAGMKLNKQNAFDDFDAATDYLVARGWSGADQLGAVGGSNGGLLVGAAVTQHPQKCAAAVALAAPFDMIGYERSGMGPSWRTEYGSVEDPDEFRALLAYSPYHRVREGVPYPPVLFAVLDGDTRVDPRHSRKMCAALQHATSGTGPILHRVERDVGHGRMATSRQVAVLADTLAFLGHHLGLRPVGSP